MNRLVLQRLTIPVHVRLTGLMRINWSISLAVLLILLSNLTSIWDFGYWTHVVYMLMTLFILVIGAWDILPLSVLLLLMSFYWVVVPSQLKGLPVISFLIPFILCILIFLPCPKVKGFFSWFRKGRIDKLSVTLTIATGLASTVALIVWALWTDNLGIGVQMVQGLSAVPFWIVISIAIPIFALANAFAEEVLYRGIIQESLTRIIANPMIVIFLQASAFAAIHYAVGFPNGKIGYVMVFTYGIMLGYLRSRTNGILAPYIAHIIADLTIGYFLISRINF